MEITEINNYRVFYFYYRADGVKRSEQTRRRYIKVITRVDAEGNVTTTNRPMTENIVRRYYGSLVTETGRDRRIYNEVGYIDIHNNGDSVSYHYYERDWLGSVRVVVDERGNIEQATDYHMGGLPSSRLTALNADRRLHTGKELLTFHGISLYDNQARWYDPILCRFTTPDPLAEKYPDLSPYSHCANNPLTIIDPSGKDIVVLINPEGAGGFGHMAMLIQDEKGKWQLWSKNGTEDSSGSSQFFESSTADNDQTGVGNYSTPESFLNHSNNINQTNGQLIYSEGYLLNTTPEEDRLAESAAQAELDKPYNVIGSNCASTVQQALKVIGKNDGSRSIFEFLDNFRGYIIDEIEEYKAPNKIYERIKSQNEGTVITPNQQ